MTTKLTLGPVLFHWPAEKLRDFFFRIAEEAPVDRVCLGEVVCSKRRPLFAPYREEVAQRLRRAGKEVVHATPALVMSAEDRRLIRELAGQEEIFVEANDLSAVALLAGHSHAIGPYINLYNEDTLAELERLGARRICLPPELPVRSLGILASKAKAELEVQVFGRLPLALSARCYHARSKDKQKVRCQFVCGDDPDGLPLDTLDGQGFLAINGIQTLSHSYANLLGELGNLQALGISGFRLSPQDCDMVAVAHRFRNVLEGRQEAGAATEGLEALLPGINFCNGYFHGLAGALSL
jgi:collagenase-like PrtC family protease